MTVLSADAALLVATLCGGPNVDPNLLVRDARVESGLRTEAVGKVNANGTRDWGITQINQGNFGLLNVDAAALIDQTPVVVGGHAVERGACVAFRAQGDLLRMLSRYNAGRPDSSVGQAYAQRVMAKVEAIPSPPPIPDDCPPEWDTFAHSACLQQRVKEH